MGSFLPEAGEDTNSAQVDETLNSIGKETSLNERQDELDPVSDSEPIAAIIQSNGSTQQESKLTDKPIEVDPRPGKRQKQDDSQMDVTLDIPTSSTISKCCSAVSAPQDPNTKYASESAISTPDLNDSNVDYIIDQSIAEIINLEFIPDVEPLECLSFRDIAELESALQIGNTHSFDDDNGWKEDWGGNLLLYDKEVIANKANSIEVKFCDWVVSNAADANGLRGLELLFRFVYNMKDIPIAAKKILAYALRRPAESAHKRFGHIITAVKRASYDPAVLHQDGWTIKKANTPDEGEAYHIGRRIMWQRYEAIIVAFTPDETYGGLYKGVYLEDLETFDLEQSELNKGIRTWETRQKLGGRKRSKNDAFEPSRSTRFVATANFTVDGIENGIILAVPTSKAAQGVLWPARVRHFTEGLTASGNVRRNSSKNQIQVAFLAPFWNGPASLKVTGVEDIYSLGPSYEFDRIEVSENNIQSYPYDELSMEKVRGGFRFLGLPKPVFARYLDAHRLAVAFRTYSIKHMTKEQSSDDQIIASANLTESHTLSVRAPQFPTEALLIPFEFIISKLPHPSEVVPVMLSDDEEGTDVDPTIDIHTILRAMMPPACFGEMKQDSSREQSHNSSIQTPLYSLKPIFSPSKVFTPAESQSSTDECALWSLSRFVSDFLLGLFQAQSDHDGHVIDGLGYMETLLISLIDKLKLLSNGFNEHSTSKQTELRRNLLCNCIVIKGHGEDSLEFGIIPPNISKDAIIIEWRKACERIYKRALCKLSLQGVGTNVTHVITDSRCNGHITNNETYERPVRIPAAIKGAKRAGAGTDPNVLLITTVQDSFLSTAEDVVVPKAHKLSYIKRLKTKIASIGPTETGVPLTEDSEGSGGDDTMGSRGSYTAAIVGVAASLMAADMVISGQCVNAFCAVRPPGHHAGRELRSLNAVSNGFCLLNAAACTALYATTPISQGGLGLRRVCIIDFDVHHGNGTQDILCQTYDPRFLYVSLHAGGAYINGYDNENAEDEIFRKKMGAYRGGVYAGGKGQDAIFPGRCGDTSPHAGVLNIPLGQKVTAASMGAALVTQVSPKVESFSPDLIILSAGFDAHVNDPLGMGGLSAADFRSVTEVACQMATRACSGRIISVLEGGYGVPCCRLRDDLFLPNPSSDELAVYDLGIDLPSDMKDDIPYSLRQKLDKCHQEGFLECVKEHVTGFINSNKHKR